MTKKQLQLLKLFITVFVLQSCAVKYQEFSGGGSILKKNEIHKAETIKPNLSMSELTNNQIFNVDNIQKNKDNLASTKVTNYSKIDKVIKFQKTNLNSKNLETVLSIKKNKRLRNNSDDTPQVTKWAYTLGIISIPSTLLLGLYLIIPLSAIILSLISLTEYGSSKKALWGLTLGLISLVASVAIFILLILPMSHMM